MESLSKQELISTITKQADQIKRYEARLRDVVAAYKGLVKEKEALEISLKALSRGDKDSGQGSEDSVTTLMQSLATLTAEKSRMEEAFQADKKVTREKYENMLASMREETKTLVQQHLVEVSNLKAKIAYEIQERENERADHAAMMNNLKAKIAYEIQERENERVDHAAMMKELHAKLTSERKNKERLEDKVVNTSEAQASQAELEKRVRDLSSSLEASQRRLQRAEARTVETPALLVRLQQKLALLEQSHSIAIREEQIKAKRAEESARKICARQEERVALLEGKLAELSQTIGEYDLRRRKDQQTIQQLKNRLMAVFWIKWLPDVEQIKAKRAEESARKICARQEERVALLEGKLAELSQTIGEYDLRRRKDQQTIQQLKESLNGSLLDKMATRRDEFQQKSETDNEKLADSEYLQTLIDKIHILKKELIAENIKLGNPVDITTVFKVDGYDNVHDKCKEELEKLKLDFENYKAQNIKRSHDDDVTEVDDLKTEIVVLKEKVETFKLMWEEEKQDKEDSLKLYEEKLKSEREYHKEVTSELKSRVQTLERQTQAQRERYATLLEETDTYMRTRSERARKLSSEELLKEGHGMLNEGSAPPHMLHYAHELARKDLDITQLRKEKHLLEGHYRDCQRDATIEKERFKEVIRTLKEEIDRWQTSERPPEFAEIATRPLPIDICNLYLSVIDGEGDAQKEYFPSLHIPSCIKSPSLPILSI
ncbi:GRIP and coiled-coil domain-containing protein 1 [Papilio machaon]|uniref:GRIP and coiled-coil domain-containing protein 1 n=1 Tax=Papilio machaon TaxID=76193 RepID=A0A0N0PBE7_PAPMA|nr:GRIP and coiled-coil domain-containing protein 1 [Papilio machaon]